jgi:hypothetical protein
MTDLGLSLAMGLSSQNAGLHSKAVLQRGLHANSTPTPPGLTEPGGSSYSSEGTSGTCTGNSTPPPPSIAGMDLLSNCTPPDQKLLQHVVESLEWSATRRLPLRPGLVDSPCSAPWPLPLRAAPGLAPPNPQRAATLAEDLALVPAPVQVPVTKLVPPVPAPPPSAGSIGHPESCGAACKYVKRKTGCSQGADCPQCHLCFWRHRPVTNEIDNICSTAYAGGDKCCPKETDTAISKESIGSANHPHGCAAPCKYMKRKGGCRSGSSCPDCHLCHWRRNRTEVASKPAGLSEETVAGFSRKATMRLQNLIRLQLDNTTSTPPPVGPAYTEPDAGVLMPPDTPQTPDDASRLIGSAPGLGGSRLSLAQEAPLLGRHWAL